MGALYLAPSQLTLLFPQFCITNGKKVTESPRIPTRALEQVSVQWMERRPMHLETPPFTALLLMWVPVFPTRQ